MVHNDPENPRKQSFVMQARLINVSSEPLSVRVWVKHPASLSASQTQIDLEPSGLREFGYDDGLEMHPDDEITVTSPSFRDLVMRIAN
jgi:hypothetical protein